MGRPRGDSAIQKAKGTSKKPDREYDRGDAAAPPGTPDCPADIVCRAREIWDDTILRLRQIPDLLTIVDGHVIADFCRCVEQKEIIERGMVIESSKAAADARKSKEMDQEVARAKVMMAYQGTLEKLRMRQNALANELGMSPRSRSQIKVRAPGVVNAAIQQHANAQSAAKLVTDPVLFGGSKGLMKM